MAEFSDSLHSFLLKILNRILSIRKKDKTCLIPVFYLKRESLTFLYSQYSWLAYLIQQPVLLVFLGIFPILVDLSYLKHFCFFDKNVVNIVGGLYIIAILLIFLVICLSISIYTVIIPLIVLLSYHSFLFFMSYCFREYFSGRKEILNEITSKISLHSLIIYLSGLFLLIAFTILGLAIFLLLINRRLMKVEIRASGIHLTYTKMISIPIAVVLIKIFEYILDIPIISKIFNYLAEAILGDILSKLFSEFPYLFSSFLIFVTTESIIYNLSIFILFIIVILIFLCSKEFELEKPLLWIVELPYSKRIEILYKISRGIKIESIISNFSIKIIDVHKIIKGIIGNKYKYIRVFIVNYVQDTYIINRLDVNNRGELLVYLSLRAINRVLKEYSSPEILEEVIYKELLRELKQPIGDKSLTALGLIWALAQTVFIVYVLIPLLAKYVGISGGLLVVFGVYFLIFILGYISSREGREKPRFYSKKAIYFIKRAIYIVSPLFFIIAILLITILACLSPPIYEWSDYDRLLWSISLISLITLTTLIILKTGIIIRRITL